MSVLADFMRMTAVVACFDHGPFGPAAGARPLALGASLPGGLSGWAVVHHFAGCPSTPIRAYRPTAAVR
jgi:hypothetical protein